MPARLPDRYVETQTLRSLPVGHEGYTVPWAMLVDENHNCWLRPNYTYRNEPHGTAAMLIRHTNNGYVVCPPSTQRYQPAGAPNADWLPIAEVL